MHGRHWLDEILLGLTRKLPFFGFFFREADRKQQAMDREIQWKKDAIEGKLPPPQERTL